jgi:DNA adenine methylase
MARPLVRYHGGKWLLAPWIIGHFPPHRIYVEPFGGGGSVLLRKPRSYAEVYNDLDGEIVNLFRDPMEQARRTLARAFMGFGSASVSRQKSGFRAKSNRSGTTPAHDWMNYPQALRHTLHRLRGVVIENRDALDCMRQHDGPDTLHYVDPPYVHDTRYLNRQTHTYRHELTDADHERLAGGLRELEGVVVVSGYRCPLYDSLFSGWARVDGRALADGARPRVESLWLSPRMPAPGLDLREAA